MNKLTIKSIIKFRRKSDRSKRTFAAALKIIKEKTKTDGGGDYWVTSLSAIANSFRENDIQFILDKKNELKAKFDGAGNKKTKDMYQRNIGILYNYIDVDLKKWRPVKKLKFPRKHKEEYILNLKGLQVEVKPHHVFTFEKNSEEQVGAIWFIAQLEGFKKEELGLFVDILFRYLKTHYSKNRKINPKYCIAVDVIKNFEINYSQMEKGEIPRLLNSTLDEINKLVS